MLTNNDTVNGHQNALRSMQLLGYHELAPVLRPDAHTRRVRLAFGSDT